MDAFQDWVLEDPGTRVPLTLTILGVLLVLPLVGLAVYLWRMAARVVEGRMFPPEGYQAFRPRPAITGEAALNHARSIRAFAIFFVVAAIAVVIMLSRFAALIR